MGSLSFVMYFAKLIITLKLSCTLFFFEKVVKWWKSLNQSLMGLDIRDSALDLARSCYEESLADMSMCANLVLDAKEYLTVVINYFEQNFEEDAVWKTYRLVIVLSYLWFVNGSDKKNQDEWTLGNIIAEFGKNLKKLKVELGGKVVVKPVSEMIQNKYVIVMESKLFEATMKRV